MIDHDPAIQAALAILRQGLRRACPRALDPGDPMQPENVLMLPAPRQPWRKRRGYMLRTSALTFGTLRAAAGGACPGLDPRDPMQRDRAAKQTDRPPGPLRNGNPRGNPNAAPRCGARTRAGAPCRSPAMPNGRCRMHGGKSTGPRTLAGLNRLRAATTKHGAYATSASRRARDPADPFAHHAAETAIRSTNALLALIRQAAPLDPDPAAMLALLRPEPLPVRAPKRGSMPPGTGPGSLPLGTGPGGPHAT